MKNIFNEESPVSEYDLLNQNEVEDQVALAPRTQPRRQSYSQQIEDIAEMMSPPSTEDIAYELEEEEMNVVGEAMVRLEQARLYDMLIKHNLFEGVEANPIALKNVQDELKAYIVERLQILLGIKQEQQPVTSMRVELPFNKLEIQALKDLAHKLTKGATEKIQEKETVEAVPERSEQAIKPLSKPKKSQGLKPLAAKNQPTKQVALPPKEVAQPRQQTPVVVNKTKRKAVPLPKEKIIAPDGSVLTQEELAIAQEQLEKEMELGKSKNPYEMTHDELIERSKKIKGQTKSSKVRGLPMPTPEQMAVVYQQKQIERLSQDEKMNSILNRVLKQQS
jgi:hypothetical protein